MASIKTIFFFIFAVIMSLSSASVVEEDKGNMLRGTSDGGQHELTGKKEFYTKVYSDKHFKGDVLLLGPGFYDWKDLQAKHFDDRIESIYLPWGYKALLCEHPGLKGKCIWFKYSHGSVYVGDGVSSLKIVQWQW